MRYEIEYGCENRLKAAPLSDQEGITRDEVMMKMILQLNNRISGLETDVQKYKEEAEINIAKFEKKIEELNKQIEERDQKIHELTAKNVDQAKIIKDLQAQFKNGRVLTEEEFREKMWVETDRHIQLDPWKVAIAGVVGALGGVGSLKVATAAGCKFAASGSWTLLGTFCLGGILVGLVAYGGYRYYVQYNDSNKKHK